MAKQAANTSNQDSAKLSLFDDYHFRQEQFVIDERKKKAPIEQMIG